MDSAPTLPDVRTAPCFREALCNGLMAYDPKRQLWTCAKCGMTIPLDDYIHTRERRRQELK